jgi:hypothetical protein
LIVIENDADQNDIDDNEEMEDLQESLLNLSVEMIQNLHESPYAKGITCRSFVRNPCFPDVAFNSKDLIFKISFG